VLIEGNFELDRNPAQCDDTSLLIRSSEPDSLAVKLNLLTVFAFPLLVAGMGVALVTGLVIGPVAAWAAEKPISQSSVGIHQINWLAQASQLEKRRDWLGLLTLGASWARAEPNNASAWFVQARAYSEMRRYPEAILAYRRNLALEPGDFYALNNLGKIYQSNRLYREAITAFRDAVQINPDYSVAWHNLGLTFFNLKGVPGVTQALRDLHASDPKLAEAWRNLALEYSMSRNPQVAKKAIGVLRNLDADKRKRMFDILFASL